MKKTIICLICVIFTLLIFGTAFAQEKSAESEKDDGFVFTTIKEIKTTPVKNQSRTGTCWTFSAASFFETELIRLGKMEIDLSEMFFVRMTYPLKAANYIRYHGQTTFGPGGLFGNILYCLDNFGAVPEEVYPGKLSGQKLHNHSEMDAVLKSILDAIITNRSRSISPVWPEIIESVLDSYLGEVPKQFNYQGKTYTPKSYLQDLGINPTDYIQITSYIHHPYYQQFTLEIPDNWADMLYYNLPLDEFVEVIDYALNKGYSVAWDGDVSEKTFNQKQGVAILPLTDWEEKDKAAQDSTCKQPEPEKTVDQKMRQLYFENYTSKDDHLMHLTGISEDQNGTRYYITKNSWGTKDSKFKGFVHMSESYLKAKTISIMVSKEALPAEIAKKLSINQ